MTNTWYIYKLGLSLLGLILIDRVKKYTNCLIYQGKPNASWNVKTTACHQLQLLSSLTEELYHKLKEQGLWKIFLDMEMKLVPIVAGLLLYSLSSFLLF
jgi:hypothetical protein